jgi:hypothetical protein
MNVDVKVSLMSTDVEPPKYMDENPNLLEIRAYFPDEEHKKVSRSQYLFPNDFGKMVRTGVAFELPEGYEMIFETHPNLLGSSARVSGSYCRNGKETIIYVDNLGPHEKLVTNGSPLCVARIVQTFKAQFDSEFYFS